MVEQLVLYDFVPLDIFQGFKLDNIKKQFYPFYIYNVNWSANWSVTLSKQVSHEEPTYDYKGYVNGKKTVYETKYRDATGVSTGNLKVALPGRNDIPQSYALMKLLCKSKTHGQKSFESYQHSEYADWTVMNPSMTSNEAWGKQESTIKQQVEPDVSDKVFSDIWNKANGWSVQNKDCTWNYRGKAQQCTIIPLWTAEYTYNSKRHFATVEANTGKVFLHGPIPKSKEELEKKHLLEKESSSAKDRQTMWYWLFGIFAAAAVTFFTLLLCLDNSNHFWTSLLSNILIIPTSVFFFLARKYHQKNNNSKNALATMLHESKKRRAENAKKELGQSVDIGCPPTKKQVSRAVDIILYFVMFIMLAVSISKTIEHVHQEQAQRLYDNKRAEASEIAKSKAIGRYYYFAYSKDIYGIRINADGTVAVDKIDTYYYSRFGCSYYNSELNVRSGYWTIGDPFKEMDIVVGLNGYGSLGNNLHFTNGSIYEGSYSLKEKSKLITEEQFNTKKETIRQRFSNRVWENLETIGYGYDSQSYTNKLEIKPNGTCVLSGRYWKTIDYYDNSYGMYRYDNKNVNTTCKASWEVILITPEYDSEEPLNLLENSRWGIVIRVDENAELPEWTRDLHYVAEYSYGSDSHDKKYLIVTEQDIPLDAK